MSQTVGDATQSIGTYWSIRQVVKLTSTTTTTYTITATTYLVAASSGWINVVNGVANQKVYGTEKSHTGINVSIGSGGGSVVIATDTYTITSPDPYSSLGISASCYFDSGVSYSGSEIAGTVTQTCTLPKLQDDPDPPYTPSWHVSSKLYANVGGVRKRVSSVYANVGGVRRRVNNVYANVGGVRKRVYRRYYS